MAENLRRIRSYVLRTTRMSEAQKKAHKEMSPGRVIEFAEESIDWERIMQGSEKRIVEIGFGMGDATRRMAAEHPKWAILGIEVHRPGVGKLLWWIHENNLDNIRIIEHDAVEVMESMIPEGSVDGFHIWFPDPWPKKKHHKRRLIQPVFVESIVKCLSPGGYIHAATDWEPYADYIYDVFTGSNELRNRFDKWSPKPDYRPDTKFESKGVAANRVIRDIIFERMTK